MPGNIIITHCGIILSVQGSAGGTLGQTNPPTIPATGQQGVTVPEGCEGLQAEAGKMQC